MAAIWRVAWLGFLVLALVGTARAGGSAFVDSGDADDPRTTVFGFVKDRSGDPVDESRVTITMKILNTDLVVQSDPQGHFSARLAYRLADPQDVAVSCAKDGYRQMVVVSRPPLADGAPIEFDCVLAKN